MASRTYQVNLDLGKGSTQYFLQAVTGDVGSTIEATFIENGSTKDLTAYTAKFAAIKPDSTLIYADATKSGDAVTYTDTSGQLCSVLGLVGCQFILFEGDTIAYSQCLTVVVNPNIATGAQTVVESDNVLTSFSEMSAKMQTVLSNYALDLSGKVDKTQKIAGLALSGNITASDLAQAIMWNIFQLYATDGTTSGIKGQYGLDGNNNPVFTTGAKHWYELAKASDVPTKVSDLTNDSKFLSVVTADSYEAIAALDNGQFFLGQGALGRRTPTGYILYKYDSYTLGGNT